MQEKDDIKGMAQTFREAEERKEKEEELSARFLLKMIKIQQA